MKGFVRFVAGGLAFCLPLMGASVPVAAKVIEVSERGFVVRHVAQVPVSADVVWAMLLKPAEWWAAEHTWSGSAANLSIEPHAGGCFCEVLPASASSRARPRGGVEHMRVVFVDRAHMLRMVGALGPLQGDAVNGTMTVLLKPAEKDSGTQIQLEYVVGGYARAPFPALAPAVDQVLGDQVRRLAAKLGGNLAEAVSGPEAGTAH